MNEQTLRNWVNDYRINVRHVVSFLASLVARTLTLGPSFTEDYCWHARSNICRHRSTSHIEWHGRSPR